MARLDPTERAAPTTRVRWLAIAAAVGLWAGCVGTLGDPTGNNEEPNPALDCSDISVARTPLRRLTAREYRNAIRDLLGDTPTADVTITFSDDESVAGFDANAVAAISDQQLTEYLRAAEAIAAGHAERAPSLGCSSGDDACVRSQLSELTTRAFRRPPDDDVMASIWAAYTGGRDRWGDRVGLELALQTILMSPHFLYHVEVAGDPLEGEVVPLDGYELASRLSFFLWQSIPDQALLDAAATDALGTPEEVATQARRMLADPKAHEAIESFFDQWLELEHFPDQLKGTRFVDWNKGVAETLRAETIAFATHVMVEDDARVSTLLTKAWSFDPTMYPDERRGLLTHPSFLASRSSAHEPSWVYRGKFVREALLCDPLPPPPDDVPMDETNDPDRLTDSNCATCHVRMDLIGHGFNRYDAIGQYDDSIDDEGEVVDGGSTTGAFRGPEELSARLAASPEVMACITRQWFRFANRREEAGDDACTIADVTRRFTESDGDMRELLVAITTSDAFRFRRAE